MPPVSQVHNKKEKHGSKPSSGSDASSGVRAPAGTRPVAPAHQFDVESLTNYMRQNVAGFPPTGSLTIMQFSHGQSNPTYYLEIQGKQYVMRKKPPGKLLPSAHAVEREYRIMNALRASRVPVPQTYALCTDAGVIGTPFFIMAYVNGRIFKDPTLPGMSATDRFAIYHAMAEVLAQLHRVDVHSVGLADYGPTDKYAERQLGRWTKQYEAAKTHEIPAIDSLRDWLQKNIPANEDSRLFSLVHGDYRLDNLVFHPTQNRVVAVLDWELSTIGHPSSDLTFNCMPYYTPAKAKALIGLMGHNLRGTGIPTEKEYVAAYTRMVQRLGPVQDYQFYMGLTFFRMASIAQGVYQRSLQGNASSETAHLFQEITLQVAQLGYSIVQSPASSIGGSAIADAGSSDIEKISQLELLPFQFSKKFWALRAEVLYFMDTYIYPNEFVYLEQHKQLAKQKGTDWVVPPIVETLKNKAKEAGLWNLFLTKNKHHKFVSKHGLTNLEYAPLCEIMGRSLFMAPEAFNCAAPDTGNMEVLALYGTPEQQKEWLEPLMDGTIRSCFGMTEPMVASSDATNIESSIERDGDYYVVNGRKWWTSGAMDPRCKLCIFMGKTTRDPTVPTHKQQSMILVPMDAPGVRIVRALNVFGYNDAPHGHAEVEFVNVRVPASNMLLGEGRGFEIAQGRLGPGRIHHCMRLVGMAERALELMSRRTQTRSTFGSAVSEKGTIEADLAESRIDITNARLLTLQAAGMMDTVGNKLARQHIAMIKVHAPNAVLRVIDRALQAHGGMGVCQDTLLPIFWAQARTLRLADGPDEVHRKTIAQMEIRRAKL